MKNNTIEIVIVRITNTNYKYYHPSNIYTMKVHVAWDHSSFKNVDLVAIQSSDPQAQIFNWPIFGKVLYFPPKSSEGYKKLKRNDKTLFFV